MLTGLATGETELPADDVSEVVSMNVTNLNFTARFFQATITLLFTTKPFPLQETVYNR